MITKMITKKLNTVFILIATFIMALFLSACTPPEPQVFGMPQSQWNMLTKAQQKQVMQGYYRKQEIDAENAPVQHAISAAQAVIGTEQMQKHERYMDKHHPWPPQPPSYNDHMPDYTPPSMPSMPMSAPSMPHMP